jgi:hypothetical protein
MSPPEPLQLRTVCLFQLDNTVKSTQPHRQGTAKPRITVRVDPLPHRKSLAPRGHTTRTPAVSPKAVVLTVRLGITVRERLRLL